MSKRDQIVIGACYLLWIGFLVYSSFPDAQCTDFYPLWFGSRALLSGQDPYSASVSHALQQSWLTAHAHQVAAVVAYPLPWLALLAPLAMLPLSWAGPLWFGISLCLVLAGIYLLSNEFYKERPYKQLFLIPLLFYPLFHAAVIKNASVLMLGIIALMLWSERKGYRIFCGVLMVLALCKPQISILFVIYLFLRRLQRSRRSNLLLGVFLFGSLIFWSVTFFIQPNWMQAWLGILKIYSRNAVLTSLLPLGLIAVAVLYLRRAPVLAQLALLQTVVFPSNDLYSTLPLIFGWLCLESNFAALGAAISWIAPVALKIPNTPATVWVLVIFPYLLLDPFIKANSWVKHQLEHLGGR